MKRMGALECQLLQSVRKPVASYGKKSKYVKPQNLMIRRNIFGSVGNSNEMLKLCQR